MAMAMELSSVSSSSSARLFHSSQAASILHSKPAQLTFSPLISSLSTSNSIAASSTANAVSYDDVVTSIPLPEPSSGLDSAEGFIDSVTDFVSRNPLAIVAGAAVFVIPFAISRIFSQDKKPWGIVSAREVFNKLEAEDAQLLDIRSSEDIKVEGTPDLRSFKKRVFQIPYTAAGEADEAYLKKLLSRFKDPENTTLYILDQFDGNSLSVAKFCTANGFKLAYAIKDGAEGPNGWRNNELPWILPRKGFTLDLSVLKDVIDSTFGENTNLVPATLGVAAAAGVSFVVFSEAETALQLLGSAALVQLFVKKFLFAKDRKKTLQELQSFLDTKVAPKELVDELKGIGGVFLPKYNDVVESANGAVANTENKQEIEVNPRADTKVEENETVTIPKESLTTLTDLPCSSTPLSPYTRYPGLKPPTSPIPSKP